MDSSSLHGGESANPSSDTISENMELRFDSSG
jgi:hypothetical protein